MLYWHPIPTAISKAETELLQRFCRGLRVAECGALLGYSTLAIADVASKVISIDRHEGYGPSTLQAFLSNISDSRDKIVPVIADARKLVGSLNVDRYFIDLDGTYQTTYDVLSKIPYRVPVAIHDVGRNNCPRVIQAIGAAGYTVEEMVDTLAIVSRR